MGRGLNTSSLLFLIVVMKIEVYIRRYNEVMLYSDEFSVDCSLPNLFIRGGFTFKPLRINYRIVPHFLIETDTTDILNFLDLRLENIYSDKVFIYSDVLDIRSLCSRDLPKHKSESDFVKMRIIEVSREEFKEFILRVIDKVFMSCFYYARRQVQFEQLYIFRTWLYNYFPEVGSMSYIEHQLKKLFNEVILCYKGDIL